MQRRIGQQKVLVLGGHSDQYAGILEMLSQFCEVTAVASVEEALGLLEEQDFDGVFSKTSDFLPLEKAVIAEQAVAILNTIGEGVCLVGLDGQVLWENRKMAGFDSEVKKSIVERSQDAFEHFAGQIRAGADESQLRHRKHSLTVPDGDRYFEMRSTPMLDEGGGLCQVATVVWEATASRRLQQRIDAIDKAGRELVRFDAELLGKMTAEQRIQLVQDKVISCTRNLLHFDHFVVRLLNRRSNQLEVLFGVGLPPEAQALEIFANSQDNGITGYVATTGRSYICNHPDTDPRYLPGLPEACSTLTVPLRIYDKVIGTLDVESTKEAAFGEEDRQMAEIFGRYIAIALNILDLLVVERFQTAGKAADHLSREVSEPLSEIVTAATLLMEDYIGHDDMRHRLQGIIECVTRIKMAVKDTQAAPRGIFGARAKDALTPHPELVGKQLLIVDDETFIRQTISDVVEKFGMFSDTARDGKEAIALLGQRDYDLVISDIKLPHATGYEVFAAACKPERSTPVILMTGFGYDPHHSIVRANREGLAAVLYKPFKIDQLMTEIRQALTLDSAK